MFEPEQIYFVTGRCLQGRLLMRPSLKTNAIIGGVLARALARFDVENFGHTFVSNHFHMLLRSKSGHIPAFMQYLRSNIAKKLGAEIEWRGKFWDRRYDAEPVLDDDALIGRLRYVLAHGVKEGLVNTCAEWPGITCVQALQDGIAGLYKWPTADNEADETSTPCELRLRPLPCWEDLSREHRQDLVRELLVDIERQVRQERNGKPVLGIESVCGQDPHGKPVHIKRTPRPLCHASSKAARDNYKQQYTEFAAAYREASMRYRAGQFDVAFPKYSYRPPWVRAVMLAA